MTRAALNDYFGLAFICILAAVPVQAEPLLSPIAPGSWGGNHIRMIVTAEGAAIEYDCAWGTIDEPLLADKDGDFEASGVHVFERGGPVRLEEPQPGQHSALYHGWTDGSQMRLTVNLLKTGEIVGTYTLGLGRLPKIEKCL